MRASEDEIAGLAAALPALAPAALRLLTARSPAPARVWLDLRVEAQALDVGSAAAAGFQRRFNGFYGVRRNGAWRSAFYRQFEAAKQGDGAATARFARLLRSLADATGRVEASFASKAVATLDPGAPVIDSVIRGFLAPRVQAPPFGGGLDAAIAYHAWLADLMSRLAAGASAAAWSAAFDAALAGVPGATAIHPVKKLDFLIWGGARG